MRAELEQPAEDKVNLTLVTVLEAAPVTNPGMSIPVTLQSLTYTDPNSETTDWQLIMLHGWGANAVDLLGLAPYLRLSNFSMQFPDAPWPHPPGAGRAHVVLLPFRV